ncbi:MAG: flavin reductase family protein [Actinomycetia bacterium]|nr:flavin reductase family protein [Actinomycetes bacterium]MCP4224264.1 flavin reductase family protein [Actinomycetes bacterium]MCP5033921.1 flavin reductase family protein [Actinomycetes bacterium]
MAVFRPVDIDPTDTYKLLTGLVVPRPIGWVATADTEGCLNLAPYSFFQAVATNPPVLLFSAGVNDGHEKDSLVNVRTTGEFTCNLVDMATAEAMNQSAAELDSSESEFDFAGLTPEPSLEVKAPRVAEAKASFECRVQQIIELGQPPVQHAVVLGEVVCIHAADEILDGTRIDFEALDAVGRMAGNGYVTTRDRFSLSRPS